MQRILLVTLYDEIALGPRILSSIAKSNGIEPHIVFFRRQRGRPTTRHSSGPTSYQAYFNGVKYCSCYEAFPYTQTEVALLVGIVRSVRPAFIGLSTRSFAYSYCKDIFGALRRAVPLPVIGGGWGPTLEPERFLEFCDAVCFGEGEEAFEEMCKRLNGNRVVSDQTFFDDIPNMVYWNRGTIRRNKPSRPLDSCGLDRLPFPDYDPQNKYIVERDSVRQYSLPRDQWYPCFAGRGCPLSCSYCMSGQYQRLYAHEGYRIPRYRVRSVGRVIEELASAKSLGFRRIRMADEVFPVRQEWTRDFLMRYGREISLPFFAHVRPEFHDDATVREMAKSGLTETVIGIQSGSARVREQIYHRRVSTARMKNFANTLRHLRVDFTYHLLNFNPFEREEDLRETYRVLCDLPFGDVVIFRLVCFPNSPLRIMYDADEPTPLRSEIYKWYGRIFAMCLANRSYRALGGLLLRHALLRGRYSSRAISLPLYARYLLGRHFLANLNRIPSSLVEAVSKTWRGR